MELSQSVFAKYGQAFDYFSLASEFIGIKKGGSGIIYSVCPQIFSAAFRKISPCFSSFLAIILCLFTS
jgi:hypothetical protein